MDARFGSKSLHIWRSGTARSGRFAKRGKGHYLTLKAVINSSMAIAIQWTLVEPISLLVIVMIIVRALFPNLPNAPLLRISHPRPFAGLFADQDLACPKHHRIQNPTDCVLGFVACGLLAR